MLCLKGMRKKLRTLAVLGLILLTTVLVWSRPKWIEIQMGEHTRRYYVTEPRNPESAMPVLFIFHGGGGNARQASRMGFAKLARKSGYLLVYPDGVDGHWNDGRSNHPKFDPTLDDVGFVRLILEELQQQYPVDKKRIYAVGPSNGGMMSHMVGMELSDKFCAIAPLIGAIPQELVPKFQPKEPVSVLIIQGTLDPLVPYNGGEVTVGRKRHGQVASTDRAVELWREHNKCEDEGVTTSMPDPKDDGCKTTKTVWSGGKDGTEVILYRVEGGGHTVPGGTQYLPKSLIGVVSRDFNAVDEIEAFFARHSKP